tara:strand:- start:93 stop:449 length:357 start_codon:yes stop_codon:yes gene_type:complete
MKNLFITLFLLSPNLLIAKDMFFECEITHPTFGTFANITYNPLSNTASFESDYMDERSPNPRGAIYNVFDIKKTGDELIIQINVMGSITSTFRINRKTLVLSGNRDGICKIVEKDLAF